MVDQYRKMDAVSSHNFVVSVAGSTIGEFSSLTGGQMQVQPIKYKATEATGEVGTRYIPGSYSFEPIELSRALTPECETMYALFEDARSGKVVLQDMTIEMRVHGSSDPIVTWDLSKVLVIGISGFENTLVDGNFTEFRVTLQPKRIRMGFPEVKNT